MRKGINLVLGALLLAATATGGAVLAQQLKHPLDSVSDKQIDLMLKALAAKAEGPQQAAMLDLLKAQADTKRRFVTGKMGLVLKPMVGPDDAPPKPFVLPHDISIVSEQVPTGGLSCKHRKICHTVHCFNVPGFDNNVCVDNAMDCTDYTSPC